MAWIKMRMDLSDDPAVILIASQTGISEDEVVGKLHRLWSWADRHTTDGRAIGVTREWVDRFIGLEGFADAMVTASWLFFTDGRIVFPNFARHNGESAKKRAENSERQRLSREKRDNCATEARPEKRREEESKKKPPTPFPSELDNDEFKATWGEWVTYRKERRSGLTPSTIKRQLKQLAAMGSGTAIASIEQSIESGWLKLVEPRGEYKGRVKHRPQVATPEMMKRWNPIDGGGLI